MRKVISQSLRLCAVSCVNLLSATADSAPSISPSASVKTVEEAIALAGSSYAKISHGLSPPCDYSAVGGFVAACGFPPFIRQNQWCWEIDVLNGSATPQVIIVTPGMALQPDECMLPRTIAARVWINAESGEALHVAGGTTNTDAMRKRPVSMNAAQIGASRITDVAAALLSKRFTLELPRNRITHIRNIGLDFGIDGFAKREEVFREIRFYSNNGNAPFIFSGRPGFRSIHDYEKWFQRNKDADSLFADEMPADERKFHQNKGNLLGTVWAKKHGAEVRFYFPMPAPEPAPQHAGKPAAKTDTNPDAQQPAAQKPSVQRPAAAAPSAQKR